MDSEYLVLLLNKLLNNKTENPWLEFKEGYHGASDLGEYISALSNSALTSGQEFGYIVFGVDDNTLNIVGTSFVPQNTKEKKQELDSWLRQKLKPAVDFKYYTFRYMGKQVVIFEIPSAKDVPIKFEGVAYIRIGTYKKKLDEFPDEERKIWMNNPYGSYETDLATRNKDASELFNLLDIDAYYSLQERDKPLNQDTVINDLVSIEAVERTSSGYAITNLGALVLAKDLSKFSHLKNKAVRVVFYENNDRLRVINTITGKKGYATGFDKLVSYIYDRIPNKEIFEGGTRKSRKIYTPESIRELVANALVHQDLRESSSYIMVEVFSDRIEISNPGTPLIEVSRFIDLPPKSRNPKLAGLLSLVGVCERRGQGVDKVINSIEELHFPPPKFEIINNMTRSTVYSPIELSKMTKEDKVRACYQHCCLMFVKNEKMSNSSLRVRFDIDKKNYSMVSRIIRDALDENLIKHAEEHQHYIPSWA